MSSSLVIPSVSHDSTVNDVDNNALLNRNRKTKCNLSAFTVKLFDVADFVPGLSSITNVIVIFLKCILGKSINKLSEKNLFLKYVKNKSISDCLLLFVPVIGNVYKIASFFIDLNGEEEREYLESLEELEELQALTNENQEENRLHRAAYEQAVERTNQNQQNWNGLMQQYNENRARRENDRREREGAIVEAVNRGEHGIALEGCREVLRNREAEVDEGLRVLDVGQNFMQDIIAGFVCYLDYLLSEHTRFRRVINQRAARRVREVIRQCAAEINRMSRSALNDLNNNEFLRNDESIALKVHQVNQSIEETDRLVARLP